MTTPKGIWEEHPQVVHYTNQAGLEGILGSQSLHATHYKYLNDSSELTEMREPLIVAIAPTLADVLQEFAPQIPPLRDAVLQDGIEMVCLKQARVFVNALYDVTFGNGVERKFFEPYIISFCVHKTDREKLNGLLSQWRAYGGGVGYAVIFDTRGLIDFLSAEAFQHFYAPANMGDVIYAGDIDGFKSEFSELMSEIKVAFRKMYTGGGDLRSLYTHFVGSAARFKNDGFAEEREVRMVLSPYTAGEIDKMRVEQAEEFKGREASSVKIVEFKLGMKPYISIGPHGSRLPISAIMVGPHALNQHRKSILERFLRIQGVDVPVVVSATPFV